MKYLIVNTLPAADPAGAQAAAELSQRLGGAEAVHTDGMDIRGCCGCNACWLVTPGICAIKDDYERLFIKFLQADRVLFLAQTSKGFVSYKMKNLLDRILPLATMYLTFKNGQMRHYARYKKRTDMGLLFAGDEADPDLLRRWMERAMLNLHAKSLGVYKLEEREGLYHALGCH